MSLVLLGWEGVAEEPSTMPGSSKESTAAFEGWIPFLTSPLTFEKSSLEHFESPMPLSTQPRLLAV